MRNGKYLLGIAGTKVRDINTGKDHYNKIEVSEDVIEWLKMHDLRVDS